MGQRVGVEVGHLKYADFDLENVRLVCNFVTGRGSGQWQGGYRKFSLYSIQVFFIILR